MNRIDPQYQALLQDILDNGVKKKDRTGTGTLSVFGRQIRHKMSDGFPLLTTKKMAWKSIVVELLWFLRGYTNIKYLVDNNCHIWDGDAYKNYEKAVKGSIDSATLEGILKDDDSEGYSIVSKETFIKRIKTDEDFAKKWGELGPIYGKQWRDWGGKQVSVKEGKVVTTTNDQIVELIFELKKNPDSRRLIVSAWNVGELDQMVLPPCHYGFQVYTRELSFEERYVMYIERLDPTMVPLDIKVPNIHQYFTELNIPARAISLMWNQRSVDTFLGLPFNIASYGLLLEILGKILNMVPDELIGNLGDCHLYSNHVDQAREQISRKEREMDFEEKVDWVLKNTDVEMENVAITEKVYDLSTPSRTYEPYHLPLLKISDEPFLNFDFASHQTPETEIAHLFSDLSVDSFEILGYKSYPSIKAPLSN